MGSFLQIKLVKFDDGERFPMLMERETGLPLFRPAVYSISMIRATNVSTATIFRNLQAIMHLYTWAKYSGFDLEQRFSNGEFLNVIEIDSLTAAVGVRYDHYCKEVECQSGQSSVCRGPVLSLEKYRKRAKGNDSAVVSATKAARLRYIQNYLDWLANNVLRTSAKSSEFEVARNNMSEALDARIPTVRNLSFFGKREGISHESEKRLRKVIDPQSQENPWKDMDVRIRNRVFILTCLVLGVRRGELLLSCVEDIDFQANTFFVRREPDNPKDTRLYQPNAKTFDRILSLDSDLAQLLYDYIVSVRGKIKAARKHTFLFVATDTGAPLSLASAIKIFTTLRRKIPDLPDDLTAHVLRHTWNDRFSDLMDKHKVPEEEEKKLRSYNMGWKETSNTAATYTRRHVRKKSMEVSLKLQRQMFEKDDIG